MNAARLSAIALGLTVGSAAIPAQPPAFESVSVVANTSGDARSGLRLMPDGGIRAVNVTLLELVRSAYQRHKFDRRQIEGGPAWIATERFDIDARATGGHEFEADAFPRQTWVKLRALLGDRFNLRVRSDKRTAPVYELRADAAPGPRLRKVDIDCGAEIRKKTRDEPEEGLQAGRPVCAVATYAGRLTSDALTMSALAGLLSGMLDRPVIDRTGLTGSYEMEIEAAEIKPTGPAGPSNRPATTGQSIFAALPEQVGLTLNAAQGAVEVIVIESAERPR